jgi:glycosyltransferase involved in cell wall biosynthesis
LQDRKLSIAMIGMKGLPYPGGIETVVEQLGPRLVDRGHKVTAYVRPRFMSHDEDEYLGVRLVRIPSLRGKNIDTFSYAIPATLHSACSSVDIVHFHATGVSIFSLMPRLLGKKTIVQSHGLDWQRAKWGRLAKAYLHATDYSTVRFPDVTTVVSETLKKYYEGRFYKKVTYIPNGVNSVEPLPPDRIKTIGLQGDDYIFFASRLVPEKGCHYLLDAFERLGKCGKKLVIAGDSPEDDPYAANLKLRESENIHFLGFVTGQLLQELISNCYVYVLPSEIEGLSTGLLEAMSYGNCVLVSDIPENLEAIDGCGVVFRSGDVGDLEYKLRFLLGNKDQVIDFRGKAKAYVREMYNWDRVTDEYEDLYYSLVLDK